MKLIVVIAIVLFSAWLLTLVIPVLAVAVIACIGAMILLIAADIHFLIKRSEDKDFDPWNEI